MVKGHEAHEKSNPAIGSILHRYGLKQVDFTVFRKLSGEENIVTAAENLCKAMGSGRELAREIAGTREEAKLKRDSRGKSGYRWRRGSRTKAARVVLSQHISQE